MTLADIRKMPTGFKDTDRGPCHESVLRHWHIVAKIRELLEKKTPPEVLIEIIDDLVAGDIKEKEQNNAGT